MSDYHDNYSLDASPIGDGGQAEVFRAQNRTTGEVVALKRRKGALSEARDRMRREIEVQSSIDHSNVMPILDFDRDEYQWCTMPLAATVLDKLPLPIDSSLLSKIVRSAAEGVRAAHDENGSFGVLRGAYAPAATAAGARSRRHHEPARARIRIETISVTPSRPAISCTNCQATRPEREPRVVAHSSASRRSVSASTGTRK